ncbi:MAG: kelch repeat-containing protein [Candidatus Poribacteria bacterium]
MINKSFKHQVSKINFAEIIKLSYKFLLIASISFMALNLCFLPNANAEGGKWVKKADMPTAKLSPTCTIDGKIYLVGGMADTPNPLSILEEYDPTTEKWAKKADMPTPRGMLSAGVVNGKIYAFGGASPKTTSVTEEYDPVTDKWTKKADMPTARVFLSSGVVNGKIYVIGGVNESLTTLPTVEEYDPATDKWTKKADMPTARALFSAIATNGKIYCLGGLAKVGMKAHEQPTKETFLSIVEEYDPATDKWTKKADMPTGRAGLSTCVIDGIIYAMGGQIASGEKVILTERPVILPVMEKYDPATDIWTKMADMPTARYAISTEVVNGKIYVFGGSEDAQKACPKVEEYTPE